MGYKKIKKIDIQGTDMLLEADNPTGMITMPQYLLKGYVEYKKKEARLIELDLLEQAINQQRDISLHKIQRLDNLLKEIKL